jgi:hypothetical protein
MVDWTVTMDKPVVFFSHSSRDKTPLAALKERFVDLTGGTINVFLSSDGQSIRLGSNWVASVEQALRAAKIMFVFVSPNSLHSPWLYFETGHAYSKGIAVIPVGLFGVDIGLLPPPMNLLQGFGLTDADSLNNLIVTANETFGFTHKLGFVQADFDALTQRGGVPAASKLLGQHAAVVRAVQFEATKQDIDLERLVDCLKPLHGFTRSDSGVLVSGAKVVFPNHNRPHQVRAEVDPLASLEVFECIESGLRAMMGQAEGTACAYQCNIMFEAHVTHETEPHRQLLRLEPSVSVSDQNTPERADMVWLSLNSLSFTFAPVFSGIGGRPAYKFLLAKTSASTFREARLGELIDLLFERGVLQYGDL